MQSPRTPFRVGCRIADDPLSAAKSRPEVPLLLVEMAVLASYTHATRSNAGGLATPQHTFAIAANPDILVLTDTEC